MKNQPSLRLRSLCLAVPFIAIFAAAAASTPARADNAFTNSSFNAPYNSSGGSSQYVPRPAPRTESASSVATGTRPGYISPGGSFDSPNTGSSWSSSSSMFPHPQPSSNYTGSDWEQQQVRNKMRERQALQEQSHNVSPQVAQAARWEQEWRDQHPGEPMPNFGKLEKMHEGEILQQINSGWEQTRQNRQNELKHNYLMSRQFQEQKNAAAHVTWSPAQWTAFDAEYEGQMHQHARDYLEGVKQAGEIWQIQEEDRKRRQIGGY